MKKTILLIAILLISISNLSFANENINGELTNVKITTADGKIKSGKVNMPISLEKNIELISENGSTEKITNLDIKTIEIISENGTSISYENVYAFKNILRKKIEKKPRFMLVILRGTVTLYLDIRENTIYNSTIGITNRMTFTNYYAIREGEPAVSVLSAVASGQANPNNVFKNTAKDYFSDYPELVTKIKDKVYKYSDIINVVMEYNNWKK